MSAMQETPQLPAPATVGIRELKQNASAVVARAAAGEAIVVTDRGRPVARLLPLERKSRLQELIDAGKIRMPEQSMHDFVTEHTANGVYVPPLKLPPGSLSLTETLLEMREEEGYK